MPDYRRYRVPGGTYCFTLNLLERRTDLLVRHIKALREAVARTRAERPFHIDGWVVLPDHIHCVLTLPTGDNDFSNRIKAIKIRFVRTVEPSERRSSVRVARGERGIWQAVSGSMLSATKTTMHATLTTSTPTQSNTALLRPLCTGRIRRFTAG
jgi:putative transposase